MALEAPPGAADRLRGLPERLETAAGFDRVLAALKVGEAATLDGVWGSICALTAAALARSARGPLVVVAPQPADVDALVDELALFTPLPAEVFPALDTLPGERVLHDTVFGDRLRLLKRLLAGQPTPLIVTSIQALLQPVPDHQRLAEQTRRFLVGDVLDLDATARWLVLQRFHHTSAVELPGEFSVRGGIVDIFAPDWLHPVRIELFGEEIESIRRFEVATQRSLESLPAVDVTALESGTADADHFSSFLPPDTWFLLIEPHELEEAGRHYLNRLDLPENFFSVSESLRRVYRFPSVTAEAVSAGSFDTTCHLSFESVERFSGDVAKVRGELDSVGAGQEVILVCETEADVSRLGEFLGDTRLAREGRLHFARGRLRSGFRVVQEKLVLLAAGELFHRTEVARPTSRRRLGRAIDSFLDLRDGDYVVHLTHGIARYRGLELLEKDGHAEEHLTLEFAENTRLYVPASKIELVQKYVGGRMARPTLSRLGGKSWVRTKQAVERAASDLAAEMLQLQAVRASQPGIPFPEDSDWEIEFGASFPYTETPDQTAAIADCKRDMQAPRPMDRLICGDVGYGKTEVAMRAAFKAVSAGFQVAVLVPTTILAEQHWRTFRDRMAAYPVQIAMLSRFLTRAQQREVLERLAAGDVDIVVGTHRLVSHDVQFANLGLVIIDEEQRFGVEVKERLKNLRTTVDVLTLTATPIPRTLHMSLVGLRDISNLETPPEDRLAIETRVARFDPELIRHAVLRELNRGGQIFFVHNRIHDIQVVAQRLRQIVPEARMRIGHGQMPERELEQVMLDFVEHKYDLLLSTTIVESGLDIPNANTIFIDEADHYGLADLHQLRGRVGRWKHRAYCYLLIDPNQHLTPNAARRLRAIEEFSDMGAGFALAMRDLEIRGAGNILGTEQSGHIAAVGYELYCQLLEESVRKLKRLPPKQSVQVNVDLPLRGYFPRDYVPDMRTKIDLYRRLARLGSPQELADFRAELLDRFGPLPAPVEGLLSAAELRVGAFPWGVRTIRLEDGYAVLEFVGGRMREIARRAGGSLRVVDDHSAYLPLEKGLRDVGQLVVRLKSLLRPE